MSMAKKRRRTCLDEMRRALVERQRQRRGSDPAGKVMLQLLTLLSAMLAMVPPMPMPSFSYFPAPRCPRPSPGVSSPPGSAARPRFYDDDRGPTAHAMEHGVDPPYYRTSRLRPPPSWSRLVKNLARPRQATQARILLEARVPPAAIEWLRDTIDTGDLWRLRMTVRPGTSDDEVAAAMLAAAKAWEAERQQAAAPPPQTPGDDPDGMKGQKP